MSWIRSGVAALAGLTAIAAAGVVAAQTPTAGPVVRVADGALQGVEVNRVDAFKGIPYAAPPVGPLRWRAPERAASWSGIRAAERYGDECLQNAPPQFAAPRSEDCLYLNVWRPADGHTRPLPVMVYIHGGGFTMGSGGWKQVEGSSLARRGVVLVTINYRLGPFGFFAHPALAKEEPNAPVANYGLLDMIAALKWVRANISAFGGDPNTVTIFGESAGAAAVNLLMVSPEARGLFERVISESGVPQKLPTLAKAEADGERLAREKWGLEHADAAALRALPAATVLGDSHQGGPVIDGRIVPEDFLPALAAGHAAPVDYMVGSNSYEAGVFPQWGKEVRAHAGDLWPKLESAYAGSGFTEDQLAGAVGTDIHMTAPARAAARAASAAGLPTYLYYFSYLRPEQRGKAPGAFHFDEVYAVFDSMGTVEPESVAATRDIVDVMESRWAEFARTGRPTADPAAWPRFTPAAPWTLEFGVAGPALHRDFLKTRLDFADAESATLAPPFR